MKTFVLGTSLKLTAIINGSPSSAKITIIDPYDIKIIEDEDMTAESGLTDVYYYIWQSSEVDNDSGTYTVKIKISDGVYTSVAVSYFKLAKVS